jgi:hypothetical protein
MKFSRRGFLTTLLAGAAGAVLDPEKLLWVPGKKTIFLPPTKIKVVTQLPVSTLSAKMVDAMIAANKSLFNPPAAVIKSYAEGRIFMDPGPTQWLGLPIFESPYLQPGQALVLSAQPGQRVRPHASDNWCATLDLAARMKA